MTGELGLVRHLATRFGRSPAGETWIGDDAAVLSPGPGRLLLTVDPVVEGVHFEAGLQTAGDVGWKALVRNLSDVAAMGGTPGHAVVSLVVPPGCAWSLEELADGLAEAADAFACPVVGGDTAGGGSALVVTVTVTGWVERAVGRDGAVAGDRLFLTGPLGRGVAGLRAARRERETGDADPAAAEALAWFRRPVPRLAEGRAARDGGARAMLDLSDGLALDLRRLAAASGVGVGIDHVPVAPGATRDDAVGGGDDYELLLAAPDPAALLTSFAAAGLPPPIEIGVCTDDVTERRLGDGPLPEGGWEHRW